MLLRAVSLIGIAENSSLIYSNPKPLKKLTNSMEVLHSDLSELILISFFKNLFQFIFFSGVNEESEKNFIGQAI